MVRPNAQLNPIYIHPVFFDYGCDEYGNVYSFKYDFRQMQPYDGDNGYKMVSFCMKGLRRVMTIHQFMWEAIVGPYASSNMEIDHIDRNPSNNCISNLRLVTRSHNKGNVGKCKRVHHDILYKGVCRQSRNDTYYATITVKGVRQYIGTYPDMETAAREYDKVATQHGFATNEELGYFKN